MTLFSLYFFFNLVIYYLQLGALPGKWEISAPERSCAAAGDFVGDLY